MQLQTKYKLSEPTVEEKEAFMLKFNQFLNENSMYFEPIPQYQRDDLQSPWKLTCGIFLQKKTEVVEIEKDSIPSTDATVNPNAEIIPQN